MAKPDELGTILEPIVKRIDDPVVLGWVIVAIAFVWRLPELIRAIGEFIREDRSNRADIQRKQALLKEELATKIARRRSHELRKE
jgi:Sec-independent protein translocase protein TatA